MDLTYVSFIPSMGSYMCGSSFPMRFDDPESGEILNVYQQPTQFEDDIQLGPDKQRLSIEQATRCSVQMVNKSIKMFHEPIVMNFHPLYYFPHTRRKWNSGEWARRMMRYAVENHVPIYNVEQWLSFWEKREQAIFNNISFRENVLSFNIHSEDTVDNLCLMVPLKSGNNKLRKFQQNKNSCPFVIETIWGIDYAMTTIDIKAGEVKEIRVKYLP